MKKILGCVIFSGIVFLSGCSGFDSVSPAKRNTWMYFYGGLGNYEAVAAEPTEDGGYLILGDSISASNYGITLIKTDAFGNQVWRRDIPRGQASALKVTPEGYFIIGSGIYVDLNQTVVIKQIRHQMRVLKYSTTGDLLNDIVSGDTSAYNFNGNAITTDDQLLYTVSDQSGFGAGATTTSTISKFNLSDLSLVEARDYALDNRSYVNTNALQITPAGDLLWALSAELSNNNAVRSFVKLPALSNNTFINGDNIGNADDNYQVADLQPTATAYGLIGTYATPTGTNANIFFMRTFSKNNLSIQVNDIKYFDAGIAADRDNSTVQDAGLALTGTNDGGYLLAGSTTSTETKKDILLIRIDFTGEVLWTKKIGGSDDEIVSSVRQTSDGGFLISGTLDLKGLTSMFLLKVNANGELAN